MSLSIVIVIVIVIKVKICKLRTTSYCFFCLFHSIFHIVVLILGVMLTGCLVALLQLLLGIMFTGTSKGIALFTDNLIDSCKGLRTLFVFLSDHYYFLLQVLQHHAQQMA